ncbi:MAG TPA: ABC transporter permease [Steroidobacteraceae bacterium]|jgi:putative ABC transport system permease protein|nr:ABC transporter permease [Steroidobacteraceae bacterium]
MKFFGLIWTGLWRKKARTIFTLLSIVVAFLLYGMLQGIDTSFDQLGAQGRLNVLDTTNPAGLPLPLADLSRIQAVHGVTHVTYQSIFVGTYQSPRNLVVARAVDADSFFGGNSMYSVPAAARAAFLRTRTGVLVAQRLAQRFAWKVGDQIPIHGLLNAQKKDGSSDWTFQVVGTFDIPNSPQGEAPLLLVNYPYYDTARASDRGTVQVYEETIADASQATVVSNRIDDLFANSSNPTHTGTERANQQGALAQIGDLDFFVEAIVAAAFATLLLLTGSTLMQAYRERIHEFAVMKTLGFTDGGISALVLSEAMLLTVGAAVLGLLLAYALLGALGAAMASVGGGALNLRLPWIVFAVGFGFAMLLALVSALPPAWRARRLSIINALAVR